MRKKMVMMLMITILSLAGCGKKEEETVTSTEPTRETVAEVTPSETPEVKEPVESTGSDDIYDPIGDVDVEGEDMFGQFVMDAMKEYSVGADGDMVVTASERVGIPLEDIIPGGLTVLFPMNPYYQGQTDQNNTRTTFSATNGDYTYQISFDIVPGDFVPYGEDRGEIFYENTDSCTIEIVKATPMTSEDGNYVNRGTAIVSIYSAEADATVEIRMDAMSSLDDKSAWIKTELYNEWVDANIDMLQEKYEGLK